VSARIGLFTLVITIAWAIVKYFNGRAYARKKAMEDLKELQGQYRRAVADGDAVTAACIDYRMRELRKACGLA
jgi:hypothetical protein